MKTVKPAPVDMTGDLITAVVDNLDDTYDCTLADGGGVVVITDAVLAPVVGGFAYFLTNATANRPPNAETWLHLTPAEYAKWIAVS